jgi:acetyl esterase/lipase
MVVRLPYSLLVVSAAIAGACSPASGGTDPTPQLAAGANNAGSSGADPGATMASGGNSTTGSSGSFGAESAAIDGGNAGGSPSAGGAPIGGGGRAGDGSIAGSAGVAGTSQTFPVDPPTPDKASKVPVSKPSGGYVVEANFAYGPETSQRLDVIYPSNAGPTGTQRLPVVLMFHGGAWIHSYTNGYGSGKDHMSTFFNRYLAHGFMVCNAEYRVNDSPPVDGAPAPAAVQDALLAAKWCWDYLDYFHGDRERFVVTGASAGGHLALMVGLTTPAAKLGPTSPMDFKIAAVVSGYGPADIEAEINAVAKDWIPSSLPNRAGIAKLVNPITYVRADTPPLIVVQGAQDHTAPVGDSQHLVDLLKAAGANASIHLVPNAGHGFDDSTWPDAEKAMFDWLKARGIGT